MPVPWSRPEPFGAWVRLSDATLVAVTHAMAAELGVSGPPPPGPTRPLEVHMAVTARCPAGCEGCYIDARPEGENPSLEVLTARLAAVRRSGASTVAFGGGEPLTRHDLPEIAAIARALGLVPVLTTSGIGLTEERARELRGFAQVNVSHDGVGGAYAAVRGYDGSSGAARAIRLLALAGVPCGVNVVLTRASFDALDATIEHVADLGVREVQLLRYKPAGRAAGLAYFDRRLTADQGARLWPAIDRIARARRVSLRIDCAMVPLLSESLAALEDGPARLLRFGVFGCEAARHLGSLTVEGGVAPCSFTREMPGSAARVTAAEPAPLAELLDGSAQDADPLERAWAGDRELERFRTYHAALPEPCSSCPLRHVCRGGCQVVSRHATGGAFAPDPECPRVRAHTAHSSGRGSAP